MIWSWSFRGRAHFPDADSKTAAAQKEVKSKGQMTNGNRATKRGDS
jgi:hypothetical protein